jgi:hypothetical protein
VSASRAVDAAAEDIMGDRQWFILYVVVCVEVGIFLTLVPWSAIWERNYFLEAYPSLRAVLLAPALRGAVAGLGLANIYMGLSEVLNRRKTSTERAPRGGEALGGEESTPGRREAVVASDDRA